MISTAFLPNRPISMIIPIWEKIFSVWPNIDKVKTAPAIANGTVNMIISGSIKLSNCAARIRKIKTNARIKAKLVLLLLSLKSLDEPEREVANVSSSTLIAIFSISSIPSPIVKPGCRLAEMVADLYLLK